MPFNASGAFQRLFNWQNDRDANIKIRADRMDQEMDGIAAAINDVLQGTAAFKGPVRGVYGTAAAPTFSFESDPGTGIFRPSSNKIGITVGGVERLEVSASGILFFDNEGDPHTFWHAENGGSGSGMDADKLDGLHASSFMRKDANEPLTDRGGNQIIQQGWALSGDNRYYIVPRLDDGSDWDWGNQFRWNRALGRWEFSGVVTSQGQTLWHAGNDGAGSGLDADKLDGLQATDFLRASAGDTATGLIQFVAGLKTDEITCRTSQQLVLNAGESSGRVPGQTHEYVYVNAENGLSVNTPDPDHSNWEQGYSVETTIIRGGYITINGDKVWHAGNDGAGSGLDADKLDGFHAASFLRAFTSGPHAPVSGGLITFAHGLGKRPRFVHYTLECLSAEHGYSVGDFAAVDGAGGNATNTRYVTAEWDDTHVRLRMSNDQWVFALAHKTTGAGVGLTNSKWQFHVEVAA